MMIICFVTRIYFHPTVMSGRVNILIQFLTVCVPLLVLVRPSFSGNNHISSKNQFSVISVFWPALWYENTVKPKQTIQAAIAFYSAELFRDSQANT